MAQTTNSSPISDAAALAGSAPRSMPAGMSIADLPPNIFSIVMATGIVSLAALGNGWKMIAWGLLALNVLAYLTLWACLAIRCLRFRQRVLADYSSHAKAPGFFTLVAGTCVLGNQFVLLAEQPAFGSILLAIGLALWCALTYTILPVLMSAPYKPPLEEAIGGVWLLAVVGAQAVSVLSALVAPSLAGEGTRFVLLAALGFWLIGSMLYIWLISLIFYRIVFLPLSPAELAPPYWINMGAMAISTLAGLWLIRSAEREPLLTELGPFLKGMTLLFWATATWWIPLLLMLGAWRHVRQRYPLAYEHGYWGMVFPLGMYTVATQRLSDTFHLSFLRPLTSGFAWLSVIAWAATFLGLAYAMWRQARSPLQTAAHCGARQETGS